MARPRDGVKEDRAPDFASQEPYGKLIGPVLGTLEPRFLVRAQPNQSSMLFPPFHGTKPKTASK